MTRIQIQKLTLGALRCAKISGFLALTLVLCSGLTASRIPTTLERILNNGEITMISRNGPTTYFEGVEGYLGFEYQLGAAFADYLGVNFKISEEEDLGVMLNRLADEPLKFAGAGLSVTPKRTHKVQFGPSYKQVTQQLLYRSGTSRPRSIEDVTNKRLVVVGNSSHEENLARLKRTHPELSWESRPDLEMMDLVEMVHEGEIDFTIVDSNAFDLNRTLYPKARLAFDISEPENLAWAFPKQKDQSLMKQVEKFFAQQSTSDLIDEVFERYYGHVGELNVGDSLVFMKRLNTRLPKWQSLLKNASDQAGLDWHLLAAISYQESHWNPRAVSPTGVKGFMMLTLPTAKDVGVKNRLDAKQSIYGGARYFKRMLDKVPDRITGPDRVWLALAAYNMGYGHLEDARRLTQHFGGNPDKWTDVREYVRKLSKRKYYKSTKHGYARGWEAVDYVQNIRNFYNIVAWHQRGLEEQQLAQNDSTPEYADFSPVVSEAVKTLSTPSSVEL